MFRVPLLVAIALVIAFAGGIVSTLELLDATVGFGSIRLGAWQAFPEAQTANADPYARAHRAKGGKLFYGSAEGLSFRAEDDAAGDALSSDCSYQLKGQTPVARAWTLYVARPDGTALGDLAGKPTSLNSWTVLRDDRSAFSIDLQRSALPGNWLALPDAGKFQLVLTLLDTPTAGSSGLIDLSMPDLVRVECGHV
nr:DUF1214 domain-containing protein [uncultured Gellertiella sp.]